MIKVILLIDCASEFDRKLLRGIMKYSKENGPWLFYRIPSDFRGTNGREEWVMEWAKKWNADAIIGRCDEDKVGLLGQLNIPIVLQNNRTRSDVYSNLTGDYVGTGQLAAEYFQKKLFTNYAFFGVRSIIWSEERCKGSGRLWLQRATISVHSMSSRERPSTEARFSHGLKTCPNRWRCSAATTRMPFT